jgi:hypothetical protein
VIRVAVSVLLGLLVVTAATAEDGAGCSVRKGLYEEWALSKKSLPRGSGKEALLAATTRAVRSAAGAIRKRGDATRTVDEPDEPEERREVRKKYQAFFQCLSDTAEHHEQLVLQAICDEVGGDRLASMVCKTVLYIKGGRTGVKDFVDAVPSGKRGSDLIWDLEAIAVSGPKAPLPSIFLPEGPAYRLIDELFLLVLDGRDNATAKYFAIAANASEQGASHTDTQIQLLLREAPTAVVKEWPVLRQYQPMLKKLVTEMSNTLSPAEMLHMRQGVMSFCSKDNLDCPEIMRLIGRAE